MNGKQVRTKARELVREVAKRVIEADMSDMIDNTMTDVLLEARLSDDDHDAVWDAMDDLRTTEGLPFWMALVHEDEHGVEVLENTPVDVALATLKRSIKDELEFWRRINAEQRAKIAELTTGEAT